MNAIKTITIPRSLRQLPIIAVLLPFILISPAASAATYYVAVTGNDSNPGTQASPFATIQRTADVARAGDTVLVNDGIYTRDHDQVVYIKNSGSAGNPITFRSINKWGAKLYGDGRSTDGFYTTGSYLIIQDFEVYDFQTYGDRIPTGFKHYNGTGVQIIGNNIHNIAGETCSGDSYGMDALYLSNMTNFTAEGNLIYDIGRLHNGEKGCNAPNSYYQNHDHGFYVNGGDGITIKNNIFYGVNSGWPVHLYPNAIRNVNVLNNTFATPNPHREGHIIIYCDINTMEISNNISYEPTDGMIRWSSGTMSGTVVVRNNMTKGGSVNGTSPLSGVTFSGNIENTDPLFTNAGNYDFTLQSSSPAIDAGITLIWKSPRILTANRAPAGALTILEPTNIPAVGGVSRRQPGFVLSCLNARSSMSERVYPSSLHIGASPSLILGGYRMDAEGCSDRNPLV